MVTNASEYPPFRSELLKFSICFDMIVNIFGYGLNIENLWFRYAAYKTSYIPSKIGSYNGTRA